MLLFYASVLALGVRAYPYRLDCSGSSWSVGSYVGMSAGSMSDGTGICTITASSASPYTPGASYSITVSSTSALRNKLVASAGTLTGGGTSQSGTCRYTSGSTTSQAYTWTAPSSGSGSVTFYAVCGSYSQVRLAPSESVSEGAASPTNSPITLAPTTLTPTSNPTTNLPTTCGPSFSPTTQAPTTPSPTKSPTLTGQTNAPSKSPTLSPTGMPTTGSPFTSSPTMNPTTVAPTSGPTASPATSAPSYSDYEVQLTLSSLTLPVSNAFQTSLANSVASNLGITTSGFTVYYSAGSVVASVIFSGTSNGQSPSASASLLASRTPAVLTSLLGTAVSAVSSASRYVGTSSPTTSGATSSACYKATMGSGTYQCSFEPSSSFKIMWNHNGTAVEFWLRASTTGWSAIGFSSSGDMIGSYAPYGYCSSGSASVTEYYLGGKSTGALSAQSVAFSGTSCTEASGSTTLKFTRPVVGSTYTMTLDGDTKAIWAFGSSDGLSSHSSSSRGKAIINFSTGDASVVEEKDYILAHSVCMWLGISFLMFIGILSSRFARDSSVKLAGKPLWLATHIFTQTVGGLLMIVGFALGYAHVDQVSDVKHFDDSSSGPHGRLGLAIFTIGLCQIVSGLLRPHKHAKGPQPFVRTAWEYGHKITGWLVVFLGIINVFSETKIVSDRLSRLSQAISALSRKEKPTSGLKKSCVFTAATGAQVRANSMFWQRARLIMTDYVIGLVAFVGDQTKYELRGGKTGREKAERERLARKQKENKKAAEAKARRDAAARARNAPISPRLFETKTGMKWTDSFTDVADDGNCQIHCVWLGLQALLQWYPKLRSIVDTAIDEAKSHHGFRAQALQLMSQDVGYLAEIEESFRTYVERLRLAELMNLEDFFTLPELLRQRVLSVKKTRDGDQKHSTDAAASPPPAPEYKVWVSDYIGELKNGRVVNGRQVYAPLGASELRALSRCFDLQIQVMTKNAVLANLCAPSLDLVDPRRVGVGCTHVFRQQSRRIVRLLNIDANHYQVHLPRDPTSNNASPVTLSRSKAFHDSAYWGSQLFNSDMDDLPPI